MLAVNVFYYSHGMNTARFVYRHFIPALVERFSCPDVAARPFEAPLRTGGTPRSVTFYATRIFSKGPSRPLEGITPQLVGIDGDVFPTEIPEAPELTPEDPAFFSFLPHRGDVSVLASPVYRDWRDHPKAQVHPLAVQKIKWLTMGRDKKSFDGYVAAGNMNFGEAAFGGRGFPPAPVIGQLDLSGNSEAARKMADRLWELTQKS